MVQPSLMCALDGAVRLGGRQYWRPGTNTPRRVGRPCRRASHTGTGNGFVMRKDAGHWSYFELDSRGALLFSGEPPLCVGCHAQAPADRVFGLPRTP